MSPVTVHHMEAVFSIVRKIYELEPADPMEDLDVNAAVWGIFLNATLQTAVHLGQDHEANLRFVKNNLWNSVGQLFNDTGNIGMKTIVFKELTWISTSLSYSRAYQITNAKNLRLLRLCALFGKMGDGPIATWKSKIKWYSEKHSRQGTESHRRYADGVREEK